MKTRTIEEIEQAFREMALAQTTWGRAQPPQTEVVVEPIPPKQVYMRIETTTTPLDFNRPPKLTDDY